MNSCSTTRNHDSLIYHLYAGLPTCCIDTYCCTGSKTLYRINPAAFQRAAEHVCDKLTTYSPKRIVGEGPATVVALAIATCLQYTIHVRRARRESS